MAEEAVQPDALATTEAELRSLEQLLAWSRDWLLGEVLVWETALQGAVIVVAFLAAGLLARPLATLSRRALRDRLRETALKNLADTGLGLLRPMFWSLFCWMAVAAGQSFALPVELLRVAGSLLNAWIVIRLVSTAVTNPLWSRFLAAIAWSVAALSILRLLEPTILFLDSLAITIGESRLSLFLALKGLLFAVVLLWLASAVSRLLQQRIGRAENLTPSLRILISQLTRFLLVVMALLVALNVVGIDLTVFAVFTGALGVGIGFGLQKVVANIISGIILLLDRSIKPGDVIEIAGTYGIVQSLGARYTSVFTRDGVEHLIPNEDLIVNTVVNWSFSSKKIRHRLPIPISYKSDVELAINLAQEAALETARVLKDPKPNCLLRGFGESSVNLELRIWLEDPEEGVGNVSSKVLLAVWHKYHAAGIAFPFPQRDLHIRSAEGLGPLAKSQQP